MIRRFLYRSFWNFYDYLGTWFLTGAVFTLIVLLLITAFGELAARLTSAGAAVVALVAGISIWSIFSAFFAAAFYFGNKVASDLPARMHDLLYGVRYLFRRYLGATLVVFLGIAVIAANAMFYSNIARSLTGAMEVLMIAVGMAFLWIGLSFGCYALTLLSTAGTAEQECFINLLKRAFIYMALAPGLWLFVFVGCVLFGLLCLLSRVGVIFMLPFVACGATTAAWLVEQYSGYLNEAHKELGPGRPLKAYKEKAQALAWQWELRQPRRTLREMLRPWEH